MVLDQKYLTGKSQKNGWIKEAFIEFKSKKILDYKKSITFISYSTKLIQSLIKKI